MRCKPRSFLKQRTALLSSIAVKQFVTIRLSFAARRREFYSKVEPSALVLWCYWGSQVALDLSRAQRPVVDSYLVYLALKILTVNCVLPRSAKNSSKPRLAESAPGWSPASRSHTIAALPRHTSPPNASTRWLSGLPSQRTHHQTWRARENTRRLPSQS